MLDEVLIISLPAWLQETIGPYCLRRTIDTQAMVDLPRSTIYIHGIRTYSLSDVYQALNQYMPDIVHTLACTQMVHVVGMSHLFHQSDTQWCYGGKSMVHITANQIVASVVQLPFQIDSRGEIQVHRNKGIRIWTDINTLHHLVTIYSTPDS